MAWQSQSLPATGDRHTATSDAAAAIAAAVALDRTISLNKLKTRFSKFRFSFRILNGGEQPETESNIEGVVLAWGCYLRRGIGPVYEGAGKGESLGPPCSQSKRADSEQCTMQSHRPLSANPIDPRPPSPTRPCSCICAIRPILMCPRCPVTLATCPY